MNYSERNAVPTLDITTILNKVSVYEEHMINLIADRACDMADEHGDSYRKTTAMMDLMVWHAQCPLLLHELLGAGRGDFAHDVFGIRANIDRRTGALGGCFLPRYAIPTTTTQHPAAEPGIGDNDNEDSIQQ